MVPQFSNQLWFPNSYSQLGLYQGSTVQGAVTSTHTEVADHGPKPACRVTCVWPTACFTKNQIIYSPFFKSGD